MTTAKGHMDQQHMNTRSTKPKVKSPTTVTIVPDQEYFSQQIISNTVTIFLCQRRSHLRPSVFGPNRKDDTNILIRQQTCDGCLRMRSKRHPQQTHERQISSNNDSSIWKMLVRLRKAGFAPKLQQLDNEASKELKEFLEENEID